MELTKDNLHEFLDKYEELLIALETSNYEAASELVSLASGLKLPATEELKEKFAILNPSVIKEEIAIMERQLSEFRKSMQEEKTDLERKISIVESYQLELEKGIEQTFANVEIIKAGKVGNYIQFGHYPQTDAYEMLPIKWKVLAVEDNKALLISKYGLDCQPYNCADIDTNWQSCSLRKWLNNEFFETAFSAKEKKQILTTFVAADRNPNFSINPGSATRDKVFLLSIQEAVKYFKNIEERKCSPTRFAINQCAYRNENGNCWWWLRTSGDANNYASYVYYDGEISLNGSDVDDSDSAVRPAIWVKLNS